MMIKLHGPYLGNKKNNIVHDLNKIKSECKINEIKPNYKKYFDPDTLEQAILEGYKKCRYE